MSMCISAKASDSILFTHRRRPHPPQPPRRPVVAVAYSPQQSTTSQSTTDNQQITFRPINQSTIQKSTTNQSKINQSTVSHQPINARLSRMSCFSGADPEFSGLGGGAFGGGVGWLPDQGFAAPTRLSDVGEGGVQ